MIEILLALIALAVFVVAFGVFRVANVLSSLVYYNNRQQEIAEALWAKLGCTREEWREREKEWRLVEQERRHEEERRRAEKNQKP